MTKIKCNAPCIHQKDNICQAEEIELDGYLWKEDGCYNSSINWEVTCETLEYTKPSNELYRERILEKYGVNKD